MEWIRISESKLKIMLSAEDARRYALNCETADYADVMTRAAFREILTDVRAETGFDATEDKIYIQMYPSKEGGCELFVTKMGLVLTSNEPAQCPLPQRLKSPVKNAITARKREGAFSFSSFDDLLALCRRMLPFFKGESQAWQDESGKWWLVIADLGDPLTMGEDLRFVREYAVPSSAQQARIYLGEHARIVCPQNAIGVLGKL